MITSIQTKLMQEEIWIDVGLTVLKILLILIFTGVVVKIAKIIIRKVFAVRMRTPLRYSERRQNTMVKLLENVITYVVYFAAILAVLSAIVNGELSSFISTSKFVL